MTKTIKAALLGAALLATAPAYALTYYLTDQWFSDNGNRMCEYSNGTVLNVGYRICPLSIEA
jgi:hypothetical protein